MKKFFIFMLSLLILNPKNLMSQNVVYDFDNQSDLSNWIILNDDVMGGISFMPSWKSINKSENYTKTLSYLSGNNKLYTQEFECQIRQNTEKIGITIWDHIFRVKKFEETCLWDGKTIINIFYVDDLNIVRRSRQYHSETLGYILTERLDY